MIIDKTSHNAILLPLVVFFPAEDQQISFNLSFTFPNRLHMFYWFTMEQ